MKLMIILALAAAISAPQRASAATEYMLVYTNFEPYYTQTVAGPFESMDDCRQVQRENFTTRGTYSCQAIYVNGPIPQPPR